MLLLIAGIQKEETSLFDLKNRFSDIIYIQKFDVTDETTIEVGYNHFPPFLWLICLYKNVLYILALFMPF